MKNINLCAVAAVCAIGLCFVSGCGNDSAPAEERPAPSAPTQKDHDKNLNDALNKVSSAACINEARRA